MRAMAEAPVRTPRAEDFPRWYQDLINKGESADGGPVRGTMVIRPYGYGLWERTRLYFPQSHLTRRAEHVEGFAPEPAGVTHGGGKEREEPVVVWPPTGTINDEYFSKCVQSQRDLPLLTNQWANVLCWEMRSRLYLRTSESRRQEGPARRARGDRMWPGRSGRLSSGSG